MNKKYIVRQNDIKDCGICCLESIIKYYGGFIPLETLRLDTKTGNNGTTAYNLIKTAKKYGFNATGRKNVKLKDKNILIPAIAHIITEKGLNHFVVIYKISKKHVTIMDPAKGYVKISCEEFDKSWTNIILIFKPYKKIPLQKIQNNIVTYFFNIISNQKELIFKIVIINTLITALSIILSYYLKIAASSIENNYINTTLLIIFLFLTINIFKEIFNHIKNNLLIYLNKNIDLLIIPEFINHIFNLPLNVITSRTSGEIITRFKNITYIKDLFGEIFITIILDLFLAICSLYFLYSINSNLFLILCIIAILYVITGIVINPIILKKLNDNIDLETDFNSMLSEKIDAIESIKNLNIVKNEVLVLEENFTNYQENLFNYQKFINCTITIKNIIHNLGLFIITSMGIYLVSQNKLNILSLITFNTLLTYFIDSIENCIDMLPKLQLVKLSINKISEFLNIEKEKVGKIEEFSTGDIEFQEISYTYNDYNNIISDLTLKIEENSHTIIKGGTGCGKSTLCKMLNHNINDYKGRIKINNINIRDYSLNTLRSNIVYVSQREKIFTDSIMYNLTLNKKISKSNLNKILSITKVNEIIDKKALRLESILYAEGFNLSGGEKQRIILARALIKNPKILILDESLSEVDSETEKEILTNIDRYLSNVTIIYISHTNTNCFNNIIEMEKINDK